MSSWPRLSGWYCSRGLNSDFDPKILMSRSTPAAATSSATICATWWRTSLLDHWWDRRSSVALASVAVDTSAAAATAVLSILFMVLLPMHCPGRAGDVGAGYVRCVFQVNHFVYKTVDVASRGRGDKLPFHGNAPCRSDRRSARRADIRRNLRRRSASGRGPPGRAFRRLPHPTSRSASTACPVRHGRDDPPSRRLCPAARPGRTDGDVRGHGRA